MKKAMLLVAALAIGGAAFAQNKSLGLDLHFGMPIAATAMGNKTEVAGIENTAYYNLADLGFQFKIATYDTPWVNRHIGLYASIGVNIGTVTSSSIDMSVGDTKMLEREMFSESNRTMVSGEFMLGPAFGVDLGSIRFQTGVAFHAVVGIYGGTSKESVGGIETSTTEQLTTASLGFALTPQFRFFANRRVSLLLGTDIVFDFPVSAHYNLNSKVGDITLFNMNEELEFNASFRFGFTPYIGLGINF